MGAFQKVTFIVMQYLNVMIYCIPTNPNRHLCDLPRNVPLKQLSRALLAFLQGCLLVNVVLECQIRYLTLEIVHILKTVRDPQLGS